MEFTMRRVLVMEWRGRRALDVGKQKCAYCMCASSSKASKCNAQGVYVPEMCVELTTRRVLVMEWVDGVRLRSAASGAALPRGRDDLKLVEIGVHCSLEQASSCRAQVRGLLSGRGLSLYTIFTEVMSDPCRGDGPQGAFSQDAHLAGMHV